MNILHNYGLRDGKIYGIDVGDYVYGKKLTQEMRDNIKTFINLSAQNLESVNVDMSQKYKKELDKSASRIFGLEVKDK